MRYLRLIAWLKRVALALERHNELLESQIRATARPSAPKLVDISVPQVEQWNEAYHKRQNPDQ